ncbi:MAG: deoxyhypusine synthase family protein [Verrucomicrobiales bacterium]
MNTDAPTVATFIDRHYRHFNAASLRDASVAYRALLDDGGKMFLTLAGAMSTAELGVSLAEMIRAGNVHAICCTGANLEEDIFNLVAHSKYERIPGYRSLTAADEQALYDRGLNRVTDTCIPEEDALRKIEKILMVEWMKADLEGRSHLPHEYFFRAIRSGEFLAAADIDPVDSWLVAACERDLPIFVPGWEDSTIGNMFAAATISGRIQRPEIVKSGIHYMRDLAAWYQRTAVDEAAPVGFFQIGGGIAGDFPICVVPMITQDLRKAVPCWAYFCQISDSTTSFGSYSGAVPNEKITWGKLTPQTPRFIIESDATIVAPLIFAYVLGQ